MKNITRSVICALACLLTNITAQPANAFYNAEIGRWANRDPVGELGFRASNALISVRLDGEANPYVFVQNDPLTKLDPDGLFVFVLPPVLIGGGIAISVADAFGLSVAACLATPVCRDALINAIAKGRDGCRPRRKEPDYPKQCDLYRNACIGSGQDCFSCWRECQSTGVWPNYKCDSSKYQF